MSIISALESPRKARRTAPVALAVVAVATVLGLSPKGFLVAHFGINGEVAGTIVGLIGSGGGWALEVFFPWVIPFVATIQGLIIAFGAGIAAAW